MQQADSLIDPDKYHYKSYLKANSDMSRLISSYDWASTSLGPAHQWPPSLLTTLGIMLHSRFPKFLFWGPEHICFYNDAYRPSLGKDGKHPFALGKRGVDVFPEIWNDIKPLIDDVISGGESSWNEDQLLPIYRNGRLEDVYWTFSYSPVIGEHGRREGVYVTCVETTRQVNALRKAEESERRFRDLIKNATIGIVVLHGPDMYVEIVNEMYCQIISKTYDEVIGNRLFDVIPETTPYFRHIIDQVRMTGESLTFSEHPYFVYVNGEKKAGFLNLVYQPYRPDNNNVEGVIVMVHNVTEQVVARKKAEEAKERARLAIDSAELGVYEVALLTNHMSGDKRFNDIWGFDSVQPREAYSSAIHPDDHAQRDHAHKLALETGHLYYEARIFTQKNIQHWIRVTGLVLYDNNHQPEKMVGVVQDITAQKQFAESLEQQVKERTQELAEANLMLQQSNVELNQFAYIASHDLQEPLRKIRTFTNLMLENYTDIPEKAAIYAKKINTASERMQSLINDVLKFSMLSKEREKFEPVDLNTVLENVLVDHELLIEQKQATVQWDMLPSVYAVPQQMSQLFNNLVSNALKFYSPERPLHIHISARLLSVEETHNYPGLDAFRTYYCIFVRDNGIGFEQKNADQIFTIFQRLHGRTDYAGTGIGLAICKKIVLNHHGHISAISAPDEGATFEIILPEKQEATELTKSTFSTLF